MVVTSPKKTGSEPHAGPGALDEADGLRAALTSSPQTRTRSGVLYQADGRGDAFGSSPHRVAVAAENV
jgi:hypothetical protein